MKSSSKIFTSIAAVLLSLPFALQAADGNWKRGRIYYRSVCTSCHVDQAGGAISPDTRTIAEWKDYMAADKHAKGKDSVSHYTSKAYRESIKDSNRAAAKFIDIADEDMLADVSAFVIYGAKDSDNPAGCN